MEEKENAVAEMFIEDINTLSDHINLVISVHNNQVDEIERLNNDIKILLKENENKEKVILKYDNIINEFEKWLVEWREMLDCPDFYEEGIIDCINDTLTKLQELKGSDK